MTPSSATASSTTVTSSPASGGLVVDKLNVDRMGSRIVHDVSLTVGPGEITVLLGTNGAGKTTLLEAISGVIPSAGGRASLGGVPITNMAREKRARAGLAHVEQGRAVFADLTVDENLMVVARKNVYEPVLELFPELSERRDARAGLLSGGEQQMLVIARALATQPKVLMLDEMSLGLAPVIVNRLVPKVVSLAASGMAILLVEQFAPLALSVGTRALVLSRGEVAYNGPCQPLIDEPDRLRDIYLSGGS